MQTDLELQIKKHRELYWSGDSEITDEDYDLLIEELRTTDPTNYLLTEPECAEEIDVSSNRVFHSIPMLSLEKKYTYKDVLKWMTSVARIPGEFFTFMVKYDGCAGRYYKDTKVLATRGNGQFGEDVSNKIGLIKNVYFEDYIQDHTDGEIIISHDDFSKCALIKKDTTRYKNPRNLVSGILNLNDVSTIKDKVTLSFVTYDMVKVDVMLATFNEIFFNDLLDKARNCPYPIDGLVIKLKDSVYGMSLGSTSHHYKNAIAFKAPDTEHKTKIVEIILQHGKNKLTPVAVVEPTVINGVTITRASLHNAKNILDNDICLGDTAYLIRSGDVIPYITKTERGIVRQSPIFDKCHICNSELSYREPDLYCTNDDCNGNLVVKLYSACRSLDIDNLGEPTVEKMIYELNVENLVDILTLTYQDIMSLTGFKHKSATKLQQNIFGAIQGVEDWKVLTALNIQGIGKGIFKDIMSKINIDELLVTPPTDLMGLDGLGYERSFNIYKGLQQNINLLNELRSILNIIETKRGSGSTIRPKVCLSGTFPSPKDYYQKIANSKGYEVVETVSKDLSLLVTSGAITSKYKKAEQYGIKIVDINQFLTQIII